MIPFPPYQPDLGPFSGTSTDVQRNVLRTANGIAPIASPVAITEALPGQAYGGWVYRNTAGSYQLIAATKTKLYRLDADGTWDEIDRLAVDTAVNGAFASDVSWTKGAGVTISGGTMHFAAVAPGAGATQAQTLVVGTTYRVTYTVSNYVSGEVRSRLTGGTNVNGSVHTANGTYTDDLIAVTGNVNLMIAAGAIAATLDIDNVSIQKVHSAYVGPDEGDLWQADLFGTLLIFTNINDPPIKLDIDASPPVLTDLAGLPPQAKFIETVGDFLFLSYLRESGTDYPKRAQHSRLNDAETWLIDGLISSSDRIECPDGDEIMGIFSRPGGAMLVQRRYKRLLTFTPGGTTAFTMTDLDPTRGAVAPNAIVPIGGGNYIYLNETGVYMGDDHQAIGSEQVDRKFLAGIHPDKIGWVQGVNDPTLRIVWFRFQEGDDTYRMTGYDWELGAWLPCDAEPELLLTTVSVATDMDDLAVPMDLPVDAGGFAGIPMDSLSFRGGRITPGCFLTDHILHQFTGPPLQATIEYPTMQLTPGTGSFVRATQLLGDPPNYSISVGRPLDNVPFPEALIDWISTSSRSARTGKCPHRVDGKFHRFRVVIPAGTSWSICHGLEPTFEVSGEA